MIEKQVHNIQQTDHLFLFWLAAGATQAKIKTNGGCCFSLVAKCRLHKIKYGPDNRKD